MNNFMFVPIEEENYDDINISVQSDFQDFPAEGKNASTLPGENSVILCKDVSLHDMPGYEWIPEEIVPVSNFAYSFLTVYMSFLLVISTSLNGIVIAATIKQKSLRHPLNYILVNLAVVDMLSGMVGGIIVTLTCAAGYFFLGIGFCYLEGYTVAIFSLAGINSIAVMAFERFMVICQPFGPPKIGQFFASMGVAVSWLYSIGWNSALLFLPDGITVEAVGTNCAPNWFSPESSVRLFLILYSIFCFLVPLSVIVVCYGSVILTLRKVAKESSLSGSKNPESEVTRMVILMVTAFLVAWLPYAGLTMYIVINPGAPVNDIVKVLPPFFAKSSLIYNPLIYIGFNRQFRDSVIRLCFAGRNPWQEEVAMSSASVVSSQVTMIKSNKVSPA